MREMASAKARLCIEAANAELRASDWNDAELAIALIALAWLANDASAAGWLARAAKPRALAAIDAKAEASIAETTRASAALI